MKMNRWSKESWKKFEILQHPGWENDSKLKDVKTQLVNLYNSKSFEVIAKAIVKTINYAVLNN